jgi:hypothetical protein
MESRKQMTDSERTHFATCCMPMTYARQKSALAARQ